jgi:hypothetical protein
MENAAVPSTHFPDNTQIGAEFAIEQIQGIGARLIILNQ